MNVTELITKMIAHQDLSYDETRQAIRALMSGKTNDMQTAGFLTALATKGETATEIFAAAEIMRELATKVPLKHPEKLVDPVGTGGSYSRVFNVSTASSIVAACAGVKIAKHGSRSASSKSGSADFLEAAGVNIELTPKQMQICVEEFGMGFMYAPLLHTAMRYVMPARKATGVRTIFNLLGPLTNPSNAKRQVLGVFDKRWVKPLAEVADNLGQQRVMVICSEEGLDELSIVKPAYIADLSNGKITEYTFDPKDLGICYNDLEGVRVNGAQESLALTIEAFDGHAGPALDMIALNTAAILNVADIAKDWSEGYKIAKNIMQSGQAKEKLTAYAQFTNQFTEED